jgi:PiT family inorganic phosphate transporter
MSPRLALSISALTNFIGPFLFGVAVATTIGTEVVTEEAVTVPTAMAALLSAIIWNLVTWWLGIPSSSSHALIGGFVGAALVGFGFEAIQVEGLTKVLLALFISPILGFILAYLVLNFILWIGRGFSPRINQYFRRGQWITTITLGLSHGTNEAQTTMGIITFGLLAFGVLDEFVVPTWVIAASAGAIALGTAFGGWRLIRTMGAGFYRIRAVHAFSSQIASTKPCWQEPGTYCQVANNENPCVICDNNCEKGSRVEDNLDTNSSTVQTEVQGADFNRVIKANRKV